MRLETSFTNEQNSYVYKDFFHGNNLNLIVITHSSESDLDISEVHSHVIGQLIKFKDEHQFSSKFKVDLKELLKELNWQVYAKFRNANVKEKGVSLFIGMDFGYKFAFAQFGRFLTGLISKKEFAEIGQKWENFHVKSLDQLNLVGNAEREISVKIHEVVIEPDTSFFVLPYKPALTIKSHGINHHTFHERLISEYKQSSFPYVILKNPPKKKFKKRNWISRHKIRFTLIVLFALLIGASYYVFFGNNEIEDQLNIQRERIRDAISSSEFIEDLIPLQNGLLFVPYKNVKLKEVWNSDLPFNVTSEPLFDMENLYLISDKSVYVYDKRNFKKVWKKNFNETLYKIELLDFNRVLVNGSENTIYCLQKNNGEITWQKKIDTGAIKPISESFDPVKISLEMDKRLSKSLLIYPKGKELSLINILDGETLSEIEFSSNIEYISNFDIIEKSIYIIENNKLHSVSYDIENVTHK